MCGADKVVVNSQFTKDTVETVFGKGRGIRKNRCGVGEECS